MLAERLPTILPRLDMAAALEVTAIHSVAGRCRPASPLLTEPPFCAPHHTSTRAAIVGGGSGCPAPGRGLAGAPRLLFLDEAPEFGRDVLDALRQPLESGRGGAGPLRPDGPVPGQVHAGAGGQPVPVRQGPGRRRRCELHAAVRRRYLARLSGPLLDRVDVKVEFLPVGRVSCSATRKFTEPSGTVAATGGGGQAARGGAAAGHPLAAQRGDPGPRAQPPTSGPPPARSRRWNGPWTGARSVPAGCDRALRLAWTLADLAGRPRPGAEQTSYALGLWLGGPA